VAEPWNSGWFWFKYPLGHVLLLAAVYAPYLGWLLLSGGISNPTSAYPYGMADPETTLATLALLGRGLSAAMGAGAVVLVYLAVRNAFGRSAAVAAALLTTFCYPFVYYAHTTNVEVPYVFWLLLAFLAAVRLSEGRTQRRWWLALGAGAAMSVSTKELGAGFFLGLPPILVVALLTRGERPGEIVRGGMLAALAAVAVVCVANLVPLNPSGFMHRIGFLTQTLPPELALKYAPYYFPIDLGTARDLTSELGQLMLAFERLSTSLGPVTAALAAVGLVIATLRRPSWTLLAIAGTVTFYLFGARAMLSLSMRYVMPMTLIACSLAGVAVGAIVDGRRLAPLRWGAELARRARVARQSRRSLPTPDVLTSTACRAANGRDSLQCAQYRRTAIAQPRLRPAVVSGIVGCDRRIQERLEECRLRLARVDPQPARRRWNDHELQTPRQRRAARRPARRLARLSQGRRIFTTGMDRTPADPEPQPPHRDLRA
jgi:hypothetical protein